MGRVFNPEENDRLRELMRTRFVELNENKAALGRELQISAQSVKKILFDGGGMDLATARKLAKICNKRFDEIIDQPRKVTPGMAPVERVLAMPLEKLLPPSVVERLRLVARNKPDWDDNQLIMKALTLFSEHMMQTLYLDNESEVRSLKRPV